MSGKPTGYSAQYITLPSGAKAHCNRQGYREAIIYYRPTLVTDKDGNFVECDARVGPDGDKYRTDDNGNLLTPEGMDQAKVEAREREENSPQALEEKRKSENRRQAEHHHMDVLTDGLTCPAVGVEERKWRDGLIQKDATDWAARRATFSANCKAEADAAQAGRDNAAAFKQEADARLAIAEGRCRKPREAANEAFLANSNVETGQALAGANAHMNACLKDAQERYQRVISAAEADM